MTPHEMRKSATRLLARADKERDDNVAAELKLNAAQLMLSAQEIEDRTKSRQIPKSRR
jgi:hypothetical protein